MNVALERLRRLQCLINTILELTEGGAPRRSAPGGSGVLAGKGGRL